MLFVLECMIEIQPQRIIIKKLIITLRLGNTGFMSGMG